ncbi:hypothetical protein ACS3SW_05530 [Roseobacteraceae bacterium S113]
MQHRTQDIQVVLVFDNARHFDNAFGTLSALQSPLQNALSGASPDGAPWHELKGMGTPQLFAMACAHCHVSVERCDAPLALQGFADALANPLYQNMRGDLIEAIAQHQRALLITVGPGEVPGFASAIASSGLMDSLSDAGDMPFANHVSQENYEARLLVAQAVGITLIDLLMPSAVHWVQSQQVFDGATFKTLASKGFNLPLYVGPFLYGGHQNADGSVAAGVRGLGSQMLVDKMVIVPPTTQDWADSYQQILGFVAYCRAIGRVLGDTETMSTDADDAPILTVHHATTIPQLPNGHIELRVQSDGAPRKGTTRKVYTDESALKDALRGKRTTAASPKTPPKGWRRFFWAPDKDARRTRLVIGGTFVFIAAVAGMEMLKDAGHDLADLLGDFDQIIAPDDGNVLAQARAAAARATQAD